MCGVGVRDGGREGGVRRGVFGRLSEESLSWSSAGLISKGTWPSEPGPLLAHCNRGSCRASLFRAAQSNPSAPSRSPSLSLSPGPLPLFPPSFSHYFLPPCPRTRSPSLKVSFFFLPPLPPPPVSPLSSPLTSFCLT